MSVGGAISFYEEMQGIFLIVSALQRKTLRQRVVLGEVANKRWIPTFLHASYNNLPPIIDVKMGNDGYIIILYPTRCWIED